MSPGDTSYDALGLMKHLSEQSAAAYATAQEVLGNDTAETVSKKKNLNHQNPGQENCILNQQMKNCSSTGSTLPVQFSSFSDTTLFIYLRKTVSSL